MTVVPLSPGLPTRRWWWPRLVSAELLKLRRRRGLIAATAALTIMPMLIAYAVLVALHAANSARHGPAGGTDNFQNTIELLRQLTIVAAVLIGATAGAGDLAGGIFRELVATGRSRLQLFVARIPGGLALLYSAIAAAFTVTATAAIGLAGSLQPPSAGLLLRSGAWIALIATLTFALSLGIASLVGSRSTSIAILLGWQLAVAPILIQIDDLGLLREALAGAAIQRLAPASVQIASTVHMSLAAAVAVIIAWTILPLAAGAWRTCTRDA